MTRKQMLSIAFMTASVFCALAVVPTFAQTNEPSLGEVARKNRARAKAKHKITEEDLPARPMSTATVTKYESSSDQQSSSSATSAASPATSDAKSSAQSESSSDAQPSSEQAAANPAAEAKPDKVAELKKDEESINRILEQLRSELAAPETNDARRQTLTEVIQNTERELESTQKQLKEAEKSAPKK
jgi:hypothetical protein